MSTLTTFHPFPTLPTELRLKIYKLALLTPRLMPLACEKGLLNKEHRYAKYFLTSLPTPPLLHLNSESRSVALEHYTPHFQTASRPDFPTPSVNDTDRYLYLNLSLDTISCSDNILAYFGRRELETIQTLQLQVQDPAYFGHFNLEIIKQMVRLRELELQVKEGTIYAWNRQGSLDRFLDGCVHDFEWERREDPGWNCPGVRVMHMETGEVLRVMEGGALVPGWKLGDPYPDELLEE